MRIPFAPGDWVIDRNNPGQPGQYTGRSHEAGPHVMIQTLIREEVLDIALWQAWRRWENPPAHSQSSYEQGILAK